ncbi:MAG: 3-deoxy-8-phosphooctulonate synthase [Acidobacteria bacterium]|nr:3-deoxy-8-phosphooctulonate synthase [Acidobacteriota bacterium]
MKTFDVASVRCGGAPFFLIAGPCVIESPAHVARMAIAIREICTETKVPLIFKASFDKANRSSISSYRGPGLEEGLAILAEVRNSVGVPVLSDIHDASQAEQAARVLDVLQIPAFLCRQTDLLLAAAATGKPLNIKKGQFLAPWNMKEALDKALSTGNDKIILTERGATFGYNNLVVDFRSLPIMRAWGHPVVLDCTHSLQLPGGLGDRTGGQPEYIETLARAAVAIGVDGLFMEVHDNPSQALSDGPNSLDLSALRDLLRLLKRIQAAVAERE